MKYKITILTCFIAVIFSTPVFAKEKLAVMELEALGGVDESLVEIMTDVLKDELDAVGEYSIISREEIEALANRLALQQKTGNCTTSDCLADMGKALGTKLMVYGSISKVGNTYSLGLRLLDTESKVAVRRVRERCKCSEEGLLDTVKVAASKLLGKEAGPSVTNKIDCTKEESGYYCQGCVDVKNDKSVCQTASGDCGSCYMNACLHSPKYKNIYDQTCP